MNAKSSNKAVYGSLLSNNVSGQLVGYVMQKNGLIRANNKQLVKRNRKIVAK
jgi:hypothetical protein